MGVTGSVGPFTNPVTGCSGSTGMKGPVSVGLTGISGVSGMSGTTGMTGATPFCEVCNRNTFDYLTVNINLEQDSIISNIRGTYRICPKCFKDTQKVIKKMRKVPLIKLPLYINHNNLFVKNYVAERLKKGI